MLFPSGDQAGYICDGKDALTKLDGRKIHLIISDVNMPNMDGIVFLKQVKLHPNYKFTPVVMLTTEGQDAKKNEGREAGAKAWIVKPFMPPQVLDAVAKSRPPTAKGVFIESVTLAATVTPGIALDLSNLSKN